MRILVAEDELLVAMGLEDILVRHGCEVVGPVPGLDDAVRAARTERLDGAILDVNLKGQPVHPVARELRARAVPFIFCTGYAGDSVALRGFEDAPRLDKPFDEAALAETMLREFTSRARETGPTAATAAGTPAVATDPATAVPPPAIRRRPSE